VAPVPRGLQDWLKTLFPDGDGEGPARPRPANEAPSDPVFARYQYLRGIGAGGVGSVHCVRDRALLRQAALKILDPVLARKPAHVERFTHEAQINAQLEHPNIVPVHEIVQLAEGPQYFTMKLVEGINLQAWIEREQRPGGSMEVLHEMLSALLKVCDALAFAHSRGVLHCDLKPENVMVGSFGEVYLMDWGLARLLPGSNGPRAIEVSAAPNAPPPGAGKVMGTPGFMAPEQARGASDQFSERTDVFGLGAILYAILTGEPPWRGETVVVVLARARACQLAFPAGKTAALPPRLCRIAARAMSADPAARYPSVLALKQDLQTFLRGGFQFPTREYPPGGRIVSEGERGDEAFVIEKGTCVVYKSAGAERIVRRHLGPGSVFGETAALGGGTRTATVEAVDEVTVRVVTRELLEENLGLAGWFGAFVVALADRFRELDDQLDHQRPPSV
jgi:serine/threonine-protein kinase